MLYRTKWKIALGAAAVGLGLAGQAPNASATLITKVSVDGGAYTDVPGSPTSSGGLISFPNSQPIPGLVVTNASFTSNAPGTPAVAFDEGQAFQIVNNTGSTHTISFVLADDGFSLPIAPPTALLMSALDINGLITPAGTNATLLSCAKSGGNATLEPTSPACASGIATPLLTINATGGSQSANDSVNVPLLTAPYELAEYVSLTLPDTARIGVTASTELIQNTPEPMSIMILGVGLLGTGLARRRFRKG